MVTMFLQNLKRQIKSVTKEYCSPICTGIPDLLGIQTEDCMFHGPRS